MLPGQGVCEADEEGLTEALALAVVVGETERPGVSEGLPVMERETVRLAVRLPEMVVEAATLAVGVGVPLQTHTPFAEEPQEMRQQNWAQGVFVGDSVEEGDCVEPCVVEMLSEGDTLPEDERERLLLTEPLTEGTLCEGELLAVALPLVEAEMQTQVKGKVCWHS